MGYIAVPREITLQDVIKNSYCCSPLNYVRVNIKNSNHCLLKDLLERKLKSSDKGIEVGSRSYISKSQFFFIRTKSIQSDSFLPQFISDSVVPILPSIFKNYDLKENDILISKDSNIGESVILDKDYPNYMISGGIYKLPINKLKYYIFAFLKNDFFIKQLHFMASKGSTIRHAKTLFLDCKIPFPNQADKSKVIDYVEILVTAIINKEKEIKRKSDMIFSTIEEELLKNQKTKKFKYTLPDIQELILKSRIDTGIYTENFRKIEFLVKNYKKGYYFIDSKNIRSGSTPERRNIGKNDSYNFKWLTPTHFSDYGTIAIEEKINCEKNNLNSDAMLLVNRTSKGGQGEYVGMAIYYDIEKEGKAHHNQGIYRVVGYKKAKLKFMTCYMNFPLIRKYCGNLSVGSKMKEIKSSQFLTIPFPDFPEEMQLKISMFYQNFIKYNKIISIGDFLNNDDRWNKQAGIYELDKSIRRCKQQLNNIIERIVVDEKVKIDFSFLCSL